MLWIIDLVTYVSVSVKDKDGKYLESQTRNKVPHSVSNSSHYDLRERVLEQLSERNSRPKAMRKKVSGLRFFTHVGQSSGHIIK